jgi:hypothetical protein
MDHYSNSDLYPGVKCIIANKTQKSIYIKKNDYKINGLTRSPIKVNNKQLKLTMNHYLIINIHIIKLKAHSNCIMEHYG